MQAEDLTALRPLMARTRGSGDILIGLIDGPVDYSHPALARSALKQLQDGSSGNCKIRESVVCTHGTFVAGMLFADRDSIAPALCPDCSAVVRPVFVEDTATRDRMPVTTPVELSMAIHHCIREGVRILNISLAITDTGLQIQPALSAALDLAAQKEIIIVVAAGNQGRLCSSPLTSHPWTIPVVACDAGGVPLPSSNLSGSMGRRGLTAPGENIASLGPAGNSLTLTGTSVAVPFVTGAIALLWSLFPRLKAVELRQAVIGDFPRRSVIPPMLNAQDAWHTLQQSQIKK